MNHISKTVIMGLLFINISIHSMFRSNLSKAIKTTYSLQAQSLCTKKTAASCLLEGIAAEKAGNKKQAQDHYNESYKLRDHERKLKAISNFFTWAETATIPVPAQLVAQVTIDMPETQKSLKDIKNIAENLGIKIDKDSILNYKPQSDQVKKPGSPE